MLGKRLISTNSEGTSTPFTSITYLRDENVGVYTQSYYGISDLSYNPTDGLIYSTSRSGVGYWNLAKTDINANTVTTITQGTSPLYGFAGVYVNNDTLYIYENLTAQLVEYTKSGSRGNVILSGDPSRCITYNSKLDEVLLNCELSTDEFGFKVYDGTTGAFKRSISIPIPLKFGAYGVQWIDTGGDGVLFVSTYDTSLIYQLNYDGTETGLSFDASAYDRQYGTRSMTFIPSTNELIVSTANNTVAPRNMARVFQLS